MTDLVRLRTLIKEYPNCAKIFMNNEYSTSASMRRHTHEFNAIKDVIFNDPATIVFWSDGTKTVVKCQDGDVFDKEKGLAMAISKKFFGNGGGYYKNFKKFCGDEEDSDLADIPVFLDGNLFTDFAKSIKEAYDQAFDTFDHHNTKLWIFALTRSNMQRRLRVNLGLLFFYI